MTELKKPVRRSVSGVERGRDVILTLYPSGALYPGGVLGFRIKRQKREWTLPVASAYRMAVQREFDLAQAEKSKGKKRLVRRGGI
jgi:hypothetical protein